MIEMYIKKGCYVKRSGLRRGMNYYIVFTWNRWWIFGECGARPCKNSLNYWLFCTTSGGGAAYNIQQGARASNEFTIEMHGILSAIVRATQKPDRNGEIKRILDFSIKILFGKNSRHARAFHNARIALLSFYFFNAIHWYGCKGGIFDVIAQW